VHPSLWHDQLDVQGGEDRMALERAGRKMPSVTAAGQPRLGELPELALWLPRPRGVLSLSVNMAKVTAGDSVAATWINPATGAEQIIGTYSSSGSQSFTRPAGWPDAVLLLSAR